jgi:hypothetical protein
VNTQDKLLVDQRRYGLRVPFGHEGKSPSGAYPTTVENFCARGTPWFVTIDPAGVVMQDGSAVDAMSSSRQSRGGGRRHNPL